MQKRLTSGAAVAAIIAVSAAGAATAIAAGSSGITAGDKIRSFAGIYKFGTGGFSGDGGPAAKAELSQPAGVAIDRQGNVYIADSANQRIRKVTPGGKITTVAGGGPGVAGDVIPAAKAYLEHPNGVAVNAQGDVYISLSTGVIWRLTGTTLTRVAGTGTAGFAGDGGPATNGELSAPSGMTVDAQGNLLVADTRNNRIRKISPSSGTITTFAGAGVAGDTGDGGPATKAELSQPADVAVDAHGNVYIADRYNAKIRKVSPNGTITTIAGNGKTCACAPADGTRATATDLNNPFSVIADTHGNVFFTNLDANIEEITPDGKLTRVAGLRANELSKGSGDGGPANRATLAHPVQMAFDPKGNLYVAVVADATIREIQVGTAAPGSTAPTTTSQAVRRLAVSFESYLAQMARDRAKLKSVLTAVATCATSPGAAAVQVAAVSAGRQRLLNAVNGFAAPTLQAARIKAALQQSLTYSAAADRAYHDWLAQQGAHCPPAHTAAFSQAQQQDRLATAAKERFVAAFNPLARRLHLRTWSANMI